MTGTIILLTSFRCDTPLFYQIAWAARVAVPFTACPALPRPLSPSAAGDDGQRGEQGEQHGQQRSHPIFSLQKQV
jgi:hypothetical protein